MSNQKKKTPTELSKLKRNKVLDTRNRANIMKIIPTWPRASLPRFHLTALYYIYIYIYCLVAPGVTVPS